MSFANALQKAGLITDEQERQAELESRARARAEEETNLSSTSVSCADRFDEVYTVDEFAVRARTVLVGDPRNFRTVRRLSYRLHEAEGYTKLKARLDTLAGRLRQAGDDPTAQRAAVEEILGR